jgi:biotin carboxyl carrier protein
MKMENNIISHKDATVESIHAKAGQMIEINQILISFCE